MEKKHYASENFKSFPRQKQEVCWTYSGRLGGTFVGMLVCAAVRAGAGTSDLRLCRRGQSRSLRRHAVAGRTSSLEHPRPSREGCSLVRRPRGRYGCPGQLHRQIQGDASVRHRGEWNCNPGGRSRKLAVSDSLAEEKRFMVFRYGGGQRRDRIPAHREK